MRFALLGSGSRGNAAVIEQDSTRVLLDCGFGVRELEARLARIGLAPGMLAGILVTHEHGDHLGGVGRVARRHQLPVWMTRGTYAQWGDGEAVDVRFISPHRGFALGALTVEPYPVPHDAREPSQFVFAGGQRKLGVLSDVGSVTAHVRAVLSGCDALLVESNHDAALLRDGPYPEGLKRRVGGAYGHLSNEQTAALLGAIDCSRLQRLVLTHLSEQNNRPELARACVAQRLGCTQEWIACAPQDEVMPWFTVL